MPETTPRAALAIGAEPTADAEPRPALDMPTVISVPLSGDADAPTRLAAPPALSRRVPLPPPVLAGYEILGELGRGGMGVVYLARQTSLDRLVALKMVLAGQHATPEHLARFRTEAEAVTRLQHPNIVQIYEVGEHEGLPYLSLEFIEGGSLAQKLDGTPFASRRAAQLVEALARAMHAAHQRGIVHRDLKPGNVLLTADGLGKISDFGLAKKLDDGQRQTRTGAIMGTPGYMAPEQAGGKGDQIGPATDVYALGAILYELLTGRPPFLAETSLDTLLEVLEREPAPPRLLNAKVDRDVETICLKCLEKDPAGRYASAEALADDLRRYLGGDSITARGFNMLDRLARTLERSRHDNEFYSYASMLHLFAAVVLLVEMVVHLLVQTGQWVFLLPLTRVSQLMLMGLVFWRYRSARLAATSASEQHMWSIWIGYVATCTLIGMTGRMMNGLAVEWELTLYPSLAAVTGLVFFVMGSTYWGRCYAFGVAFFALALLMALRLDLGPLAFGALWAGSLVAIGWHLQQLGARAGQKARIDPDGNKP